MRGNTIFISKTNGGETCPVTWVMKYLELANIYIYIFVG